MNNLDNRQIKNSLIKKKNHNFSDNAAFFYMQKTINIEKITDRKIRLNINEASNFIESEKEIKFILYKKYSAIAGKGDKLKWKRC